MNIPRSFLVTFGGLLVLLVAFFSSFREVDAQVVSSPPIEIRQFGASRVGTYLLDVCVLQIEGTDEGAVNCQGRRGLVTGYEEFLPLVQR